MNSDELKKKAQVIYSDNKGHYRVELAPGRYTVLFDIDDVLTLNCMDSHDNYSSVEVKAGETTVYDLSETSKSYC